ncbi:MAG: cytochrome C [bacterium]|nr:cytochrome C [bacterium]
MSIIFPPDGSALEWGGVEVVGLAPAGIDEVEVVVSNGVAEGGARALVENGAFSKLVRFKSGKGRISVTAREDSIRSNEVGVFVQGNGKTPSGFRAFHRHLGISTLGDCGTCHNLRGRTPSYRRLRPAATCQAGECHQEMGGKKFVHGPVGSGTCVHCHNPHGSFLPKTVSREGRDLCIVCHRDAEEFWEKSNIHSPVEEGNCTGCHDPHESDTRFQLIGNSVGDTCFNCHDRDSKVGGTVSHEPVRQLECTLCHNPHSDDNRYMLEAEGNAVCYSCHEGKQQEFAQAVQHKPVTESCLQCHDAHTGNHAYMLLEAPDSLCMSCHQKVTPEIVAEIETASQVHQPVEERRCIACHASHATQHASLLHQQMPQLCFSCHEEMGERVTSSTYPHGPVESGDCLACHKTHGSENPKLLSAYFPAEFYKPYAEESYDLCFQCHESDVAREENTTELTDFRNGSHNLHYLHVHREKKGRSCKACHELHGGLQEKHIREEVPFGDMWSYPIVFTRTDSGGKCVVGCHKPKEYDRLNPVRYE